MTMRISTTLVIDEAGSIACGACGHALAEAGRPWKPAARLDEAPLAGAGGAPFTTAPEVLLRRFYCPGCGALLDSETTLPGDPFLNDVVQP